MENRINQTELEQMDRIKRLNLINSLSGYKSANLIGTKSPEGISNLTIISSLVHLSSSPAMVGFMQRPTTVPRHTYTNIVNTHNFTVNQVNKDFVASAHYTSAKFEQEESEFEKCGFTEEYKDNFYAPFVKHSHLKLSVRFVEEIHIKASNTILMVGAIENIYLPGDVLLSDGQIDLNKMDAVCVSGLNNYHVAKHIASFSYARPGQFPQNEMIT